MCDICISPTAYLKSPFAHQDKQCCCTTHIASELMIPMCFSLTSKCRYLWFCQRLSLSTRASQSSRPVYGAELTSSKRCLQPVTGGRYRINTAARSPLRDLCAPAWGWLCVMFCFPEFPREIKLQLPVVSTSWETHPLLESFLYLCHFSSPVVFSGIISQMNYLHSKLVSRSACGQTQTKASVTYNPPLSHIPNQTFFMPNLLSPQPCLPQ